MSGVHLDLNSLPEEGRPSDVYEYMGVLRKDDVIVSPVAVKNLPFKLGSKVFDPLYDKRNEKIKRNPGPSELNFSKIEHASLHPIETLPAFELHPLNPHPDPTYPDRRQEWQKFLSYLYARDKVIPITYDEWELFIKPPKVAPNEKSSVRVCYRKRRSNRAPAQQVPSSATRQPTNFSAQLPIHSVQPGPDPEPAASPYRSGHVDNSEKNIITSSTLNSLTGCEQDFSERVNAGKVHVKPIESNPRRLGQMHPSYLQTLAQLHASWQFGGLAELIDNARDAQASRLNITIGMVKMKGKSELTPMLKVEDNGRGMNHEEIVRMLQFGHKRPAEYDEDHIGHFGVGFKSGSMRLGKDVIVLTQSKDSRSIGFLSTAYNADKEVLEVPIVTYRQVHGVMELDESVQTEEEGQACLQAVKKFSPYNEFEIGSFFDKIGGGNGKENGTTILIYNLDRWGKEYALQWDDEEGNKSQSRKERDITIRSKRVRARPSQTSKEIPLDYSLRAYLEVLFLDPRMIIRIQGSKVKTRRLKVSLNRTSRKKGTVCGTPVELTLGRFHTEYKRGNCGIFLYWHGRLIEAYKRVGGMVHSADVGRGVIGVIDVTSLMVEHEDGRTSVLNTKQSFEDCEEYAMLEQWLGEQFNDYWNTHFDNLEVVKDVDSIQANFEPDREWVQCDKCRKWRKLPGGVHSSDLPDEWFCYMNPYSKTCNEPEEKADDDIVTVGVNRTSVPPVQSSRVFTPKVEIDDDDEDTTPVVIKRQSKKSAAGSTPVKHTPAVRTRESPPSPRQGNMSPIRKRLRKRN